MDIWIHYDGMIYSLIGVMYGNIMKYNGDTLICGV